MSIDYQFSGSNLASKILPGERILHIGYDNHLFEGIIPNYIHVDDLESYAQSNRAIKFNVAFCLEYINFGSVDIIENQIAILVSMLREHDTRIYWRCNPGVQDYIGEQNIFPWTFEEHTRLAEKFKYEISYQDWDDKQRLYVEWSNTKHSLHYYQSD